MNKAADPTPRIKAILICESELFLGIETKNISDNA
jgi:hypothetical protein